MNSYNKSKIYTITPINGDIGDVYVGCTRKDLNKRYDQQIEHYYKWYNHRRTNDDIKKVVDSSIILLHKYGYDYCNIILLEDFNCDSKKELNERMKFYIDKINCVNRCNTKDLSCYEIDTHKYKKDYNLNISI